MWVITQNGSVRNLAQAYKIEHSERYGKVAVYATFPICANKNSADPAFAETAILKICNSIDDAKNYIAALVNELNGNKPKLGYAFTWLAKVKQLPPDKQAEFNDMVEDWLDDFNKIPADVKPKKFNDDGIEW